METTPNTSLGLRESKWKRFSEWIHCICVITFDLELGQAMEFIYPTHVQFSEQEKLNICYLAFPDSNSGCMGDTQFHIRLRVSPATKNTVLSPELRKFNKHCVSTQRADSGHYWGYVYFRQIKDSTLPRGYFQKSLVVLSRLPFTNLFYEISALIAPTYFANGEHVLQAVCTEISNWPPLKAGECIQLPLLGTVYQTYIPSLTSANLQQLQQQQQQRALSSRVGLANQTSFTEPGVDSTGTIDSRDLDTENNDNLDNSKASNEALSDCTSNIYNCDNSGNEEDSRSDTVCKTNFEYDQRTPLEDYMQQCSLSKSAIVLSSVNEIDIFRSLYSVLPYTHLLWELVLTAEPIVVMATSPSDCSHMVQSLTSLIAPLSYCAEYRPYFTIHDSEFKEFTQRQQGPPPLILGVTNPFFSKTLQHWPHTIRLADNVGGTNGGNADHLNHSNAATSSSSISGSYMNQQKFRKLKIFSKVLDSPPGVYTQYKPFLQKDKNLIKNLLAGVKKQRPAEVQSALLRRHLLELTQSFMIPLERYMASLMPLQKDISAFRAAPTPNHFKQDCFLATIEQSGPQLTSPLKGDWCGLYKRFFRSPNFREWYDHRYMELTKTLQHLQLQALSNADLEKWVEGRQEVEIIDMILRVKQKLKIIDEMPTEYLPQSVIVQNNNTRQQLLRHLDDMKKQLPEDLKKILNNK